jgi:Peptidase family M28
MFRTPGLTIFIVAFGLLLTACQTQTVPPVGYDPGSLRFSGERAMEIETEFVTQFPHRHSGQPNNGLAAEWLFERFTDLGWDCKVDRWEIINYSRLVPLNNVVCILPGELAKEILVVAHLDQASTTVQGADNDGSGIAILLHLAEVFAAEQERPYTLTFVATDAEEYGMIGSQRYIQTHPNTHQILAGFSLDNLGRTYYDDMDIELVGQYRNYGPIWLVLAAREAARVAEASWKVNLRAPFDQVTDQAAPVSFMDQGPMVAAGVPALGFTGHAPAHVSDLHYHLWHDPDDTLAYQSAESLGQAGLITEALIRQLLSMESFPQESGPYLYFDDTQQVLKGAPLWAIFISFVGLFLLASIWIDPKSLTEKLRSWLNVLPHFLGLWLPLLASIILLYGFVAVGLMNAYHTYPATTKDPDLLHPRWPAIILFLIGLGCFLYLGRHLAWRYAGHSVRPRREAIKSFAFFVITLSGIYVLLINPFSLLFFVPLLFWFLIQSRQGVSRGLDILFFLLGGLVVYMLIYSFGFLILRYDLAFLWYMMNMFSIRMIGFPTAAMITAIIAAGLTMIVKPPKVY